MLLNTNMMRSTTIERQCINEGDYERLLVCNCINACVCCFFERNSGKNTRVSESENENKGPCIGGGVEWMRQLYSP